MKCLLKAFCILMKKKTQKNSTSTANRCAEGFRLHTYITYVSNVPYVGRKVKKDGGILAPV